MLSSVDPVHTTIGFKVRHLGLSDRSDWGLTWNMPLAGGGLFVGEKASIDIEGQVVQGQEAAAGAGAEAGSSER